VKKNIDEGLGPSHRPDQEKKPHKRISVVHWWAGIGVKRGWLGCRGIGRANFIRAVGTIHTDAPLALAYSPLKRVQEKSQDEENEELGKNDMERFLFFGCKFGFYFVTIVVDFGMVVIGDASLQFGWMTNESTGQRCSLCRDPLRSGIIRRWETARVAKTWWRL
jgi:hypothetical protein